ncbi:type I phosphodiesterase/nucleotide pyrophosphatase [Dyadobacter jejuensis]|uniref:Type I phosphodiesterase/nucleotide pyrophosphatase n=1 Tax=Dyadobacter jejuensis TaxID=1082580 RepID=A0A316AJ64_9BACT|nr:alkaline phosphatase family protein [Dyadobacter jejuensis]PWJ57671.1 type I phosphodiesterase/nucleotide pyrophosphatase [Dyadobacter jejuensis]
MKNKRLILALLAILSSSHLLWAQAKTPKALFVIVDGISSDVIEKIETPHLDAVAKVGGYTQAYVGGEKDGYSQTPTISAVGYNSLLTGTWVNKHNVWGNGIKDPNYQYWSIFRFFKEQFPQKKTAVFSTWLDNRTKLIGEGLPQTNHLRIDYPFDGFELDTIHFPHDKLRNYIHLIDEKVTDEAAQYVRAQAPDLAWVYLEYTDDMGHGYGDSPQFHDAIRTMDQQIGRIWEAIQYRQKNFQEDWMLFVTTDHGRDPKNGSGHGGQSDRERSTWMVTNAKDLNQAFKDRPGIVDIMPTLAGHMGVHFPKEQAFELDGVPLVGSISIDDAQAVRSEKQIAVSWKAYEPKSTVKVWLTTTNQFKDGGRDLYHLVDQVPAGQQKLQIDISQYDSDFFKIVLEGAHNSLNRWIVK